MSGKKSNNRQKRIQYPAVRNQKTITDFATRIKTLLRHCRMSPAQLSRYAEINYDYLIKIIKGEVNPSICHQEKIADGFTITVSQLTDYNFFPVGESTIARAKNDPITEKTQLAHIEN